MRTALRALSLFLILAANVSAAKPVAIALSLLFSFVNAANEKAEPAAGFVFWAVAVCG